MNIANDLLDRVMGLPTPERAALAHHLLLSLEPDDFDADSEGAWAAEIEARMALVEQGNFSAQDWREAIADIRQSLKQGRSS